MNQKEFNGLAHPSRRDVLAMLGLAGLAADTGTAFAETSTWPSGPGRVIVAYSPGTSTDNFARALALQFQTKYGQNFIDENRPGAGGWTGTLYVSQSKPDGLTLTVNANGIAIYGIVQKNTFDATKDLTPLAMLATSPVALLVPSSLPVTTVKEFVAYCKAHPNDVFYASSGVGSAVHLYSELFNLRAGVHMRHVPYRGLGEALPDFIAGRIQILFSSYATGAGLIKDGKVRLLAYGDDTRPEGTLPAPSVRESGIDYEASNWWALFGPPNMPPAISQKINEATNIAIADPSMAKLFQSSGVIADPKTLDQVKAEVKSNYVLLKEVIDAAKITF